MSFWTADRNRAAGKLDDPVKSLIQNIETERKALVAHPVYNNIRSVDELYIFMQHHVFAVWDFMSLLKSLQRMLSCVEVPWVPVGDPHTRRLVNDIVMSEETDEAGNGGFSSHFELYLGAMQQVGADTAAIDDFVARMRRKERVEHALDRCGAPSGARRFVETTFSIINTGDLHRIAACFTFGREDVVPDMFRNIVVEMRKSNRAQLDRFIYYLDRHIAVDTDVHGPMAFDMIARLCGDDARKWEQAQEAAIFGIRSRVKLWDSVVTTIHEHRAAQAPKRSEGAKPTDRDSKLRQMLDNRRAARRAPDPLANLMKLNGSRGRDPASRPIR
ncbi:MAG: DUF3050 domain-containing protein [Xanthobacteraceae bacterium]